MLLADAVATHRAVSDAPGRTRKAELVAELLERASSEELPVLVGLLAGRPRQGRIGVGPALLRSLTELDGEQRTAALEPSVDGGHGQPIHLLDLDEALSEIAAVEGAGARARRAERLRALLRRATVEEQAFIRRLVIGELRQGAAEGVLLDAVVRATGASAADVRKDVLRLGGATAAAERHLGGGEEADDPGGVRLFRPLSPMLAATAEDAAAALAAIPHPLLEAKADGARVQLHRRGGEIRVYTRHGNDVTGVVPEVVAAGHALPGGDLVLDGEAVGWGTDGPLPFQLTMRRVGAREPDPALLEELPLRVFWFDCLYAAEEGELVDRPLRERRHALRALVPDPFLLPSRSLEAVQPLKAAADDAVRAVEEFLREVSAAGFEGLMVKDPGSSYRTGRRGGGWLKLKPVLTLDLVVLAAEWGSGRRRGWLSNLHLGARGGRPGDYVMLGKTFKGMTDRILAWQTDALLALETHRDARTVYVRPEKVVEVAFEGVQRSPRYPGGVSLRFARLRRYRDDKAASEADAIETVLALLPDDVAAPARDPRRTRGRGARSPGDLQHDLFEEGPD